MNRPTRSVVIRDRIFTIEGLSADDTYFQGIGEHFDHDFATLIGRLVRDEYVCVDLGANIGVISLLLSGAAKRGTVISVEAAPTVFEILKRNIADSGISNVKLSSCAISDGDGEVRFSDNSAYGHISPDGVTVPAKRLQTILAEHGVDHFDFIKIDVEGFEYSVLKNALPLINQNKALVLLEFNSWCQMTMFDTSPLEFANWLLQTFSHVYALRRGPAGISLERLNDGRHLLELNLLKDGCVSDILVTNAPGRLIWQSTAEATEAQITQLKADLQSSRAERDLIAKERDAAITQLDALVTSFSWRISAPLRWLRGMMR